MKITVFLGSSGGTLPKFVDAVEEFGRWIAENGHTLVYGGTNDGLMKVLADTVLGSGGKVIGVVPNFMAERGDLREDLTDTVLVDTMAERKSTLLELGDVFVAMPGGVGTLEEISEAVSARKLGFLEAPCVFLNIDGFWEPMRQQLQSMKKCGFYSDAESARVRFASDVPECIRMLHRYSGR